MKRTIKSLNKRIDIKNASLRKIRLQNSRQKETISKLEAFVVDLEKTVANKDAEISRITDQSLQIETNLKEIQDERNWLSDIVNVDT